MMRHEHDAGFALTAAEVAFLEEWAIKELRRSAHLARISEGYPVMEEIRRYTEEWNKLLTRIKQWKMKYWKYKIGDVVRIKPEYRPMWMTDEEDAIREIVYVDETDSDRPYQLDGDDDFRLMWWGEEMLEQYR